MARFGSENDTPVATAAPSQRWQDSYADPEWKGKLTKLSPEEETKFQAYAKETNSPITDDYDMRGFWKDPTSKTSINPNDGKIHWNDKYKTPIHESFSGESIYSRQGIDKPKWNDKDQLVGPDGKVLFDEPEIVKQRNATKPQRFGHDDDVPVAHKEPPGTMVGARINKNIADTIGAPVDMARGAVNQLAGGARTVYDLARGEKVQKEYPDILPHGVPGDSKWLEDKARKANLVTDKAYPTDTMGKIGAGAVDVGMGLAPVAPGMIRKAIEVPAAIKSGIRTLTGSGIPAAKAEAQAATRGALQSGEQGLTDGAAKDVTDAGRWSSLQDKATGQLAETRKPGPVSLDSIGSDIHTGFNSAIESAKGSRAQKANEMFNQVKADAAAKEATGARVNTQGAEEALKAFSKEAEGIPELRDQATKMLSAIRGKPAVAAPKVTGNQPWIGVGETVAPEPAGKTFEQLELTRRYLNDIAYSGDMEGYSAIVKGKARDTAHAIDSAMQEFLPSFGEYKTTYRTMSEPLDSLNTRLGKALSGTEGGLQGTEYSKIAKADLPNKLFAKKEGIDLLTDAIAGGKNAPAEARAAAKLKVNGMVEDWIAESVRQKTSKAASNFVAAPKMQSALDGRVPPSIENMIARKGQLEGRVESFGSKAKGLEAEAETKIKTAQTRFTDKIAKGDYLAQHPAFQADAYAEYRSALTTAGSAKLIPETQFKAALKLLNDAATMEEKTETARRLVKKMGLYGAGTVGAAYEGTRLFQ